MWAERARSIRVPRHYWKECAMERYESWESLADQIELTTEVADCWTCFIDV